MFERERERERGKYSSCICLLLSKGTGTWRGPNTKHLVVEGGDDSFVE